MLDALVHGKDGEVAGVREATVPVQRLKTSQDLRTSITVPETVRHDIWTWYVQQGPVQHRLVRQQGLGIGTEQVMNGGRCGRRGHRSSAPCMGDP